ncbi:MAG: hypothetical protein HY459_04660, partial [Parcubacteria group bacterium]|nr:hypothetical protein [Parcubacteria group bacterium]
MISRRLLYLLVVILLLFFGSEFVVFSLAMPRSAHASLPLPVSQEKLAINLSYSVVTSRPLMRGIERSLAAAQRMTNEILSNIAERGVVATRKVRALVNATQEIAQRSWEGIEEIKTSVSLPTLDRTLLPPSWQRSIAAIDEALRSSLTASTNQLNSHDLVLESIQPRDSESKGLVLGVTSSSSATLITHAPSRLNFLLTSTGQLPRSIRNPFTLLRNAIANFSVTIPSRTLFVELPQPSRFAEGSKLRAEREPPNETPGSQTEPGRMAGPSPGPTPRTIIVSSEAPRETITVVREVQATTNLPQLTVTRDVLIGGGLTVQGNTVLTSALTVGNDALFQKSVTVNSNLTVEGTLSAGNLAFDTFTPERLRLTGKPSGGDLNQATLFIDVPSDTSGGAPLIGVAVGGSERLRFDAGGNLVVTGIIAGRNALSPNPASVPSIQPLIIPSTFDSLMVTSSFLSGGITALGDTTTDRILFTGRVATDILPLDNNQYDLGTASGASPKKFRTGNFGTSVVVNNGTDSSTFTHNTLTGSNTFTFSTAAGNLILQPVSSAYTQIGASGTPVLVADSNDLFIKDALETGGRTLITGNPAGTSVTQGSLVVNPAAPTANQIVFGVANNGTALFTVDAEGDVSVVGNLSSGGISARLDQIVAATTQAGAQDSNANTVEWNWDFTAAGVDSGLIISESTASTLGTQDQQALLEITTLSGSTAAPLQVTSTSADVGDIWFNLASAGDLEIRDAGTAFATFADSGAITFAPTGSSDTTFSLDSDTNLQYVLSGTSGAITYLTGSYTGAQTLAAAASLTGLSLDLSTNVTADAGGNAITGLLLTVPNGGAGTTYGIDIAGASDNGIRIGGATTDITTGTNEDLTLLANGSGVIVLNDSAKINSTNTLEFGAGVGGKEANAGKIGYQAFTADSLDIIGAGSASPNRKVTIFDKLTVNNGIAIGEGAGTTGARISPTSGNELIINRASGADTIWFGEAADSGVYTFRGTGGITISGATTDITTGTNEALTITANGTGDITLAGDTDTDVIFSGGTTDITTGTNEALTIVPNGSGDTVFNLDSDTNIQYALSGTSGAITYLTGSYGSGATLAAAASLTG